MQLSSFEFSLLKVDLHALYFRLNSNKSTQKHLLPLSPVTLNWSFFRGRDFSDTYYVCTTVPIVHGSIDSLLLVFL